MTVVVALLLGFGLGVLVTTAVALVLVVLRDSREIHGYEQRRP